MDKKTTKQIFDEIRPDDEEEDNEVEEVERAEEQEEASDDADDSDSDDGDDDGDPDDKDVPKQKAAKQDKSPTDYYFERRRKKQSREQDLILEENRRLTQRLDDLQKRIEDRDRPAKEEDPDTNPFNKDSDPLGHSEWEQQANRKQIDKLKKEIEEDKARAAEQSQITERDARIADYAAKVDSALANTFREVPEFESMFRQMNMGLVKLYQGQGFDERRAAREASLTLLNVAFEGEKQGLSAEEALYRQAVELNLKPQIAETGNQTSSALDKLKKKNKAPRSINSRPGGKGRPGNSLEALKETRDRDVKPEQIKDFWGKLRDQAGAR
jgi:hypothetical protein